MCVKTMDAESKRVKTDRLLQHAKPGSALRLRLLRVTAGDDVASGQCRASAVKATVRKYLRRQRKRARLAKLAKVLGVVVGRRKMEAVFQEGPAEARMRPAPPRAMAPANTTQYLMNNVYEDMEARFQAFPASRTTPARPYDESLSPRSVYAALDCDYDSCLAFQQRDFEEVFDLSW